MATYTTNVTDGITFTSTLSHAHATIVNVSDHFVVSQPKPATNIKGNYTLSDRVQLRTSMVTRGLFHYMLASALRLAASSPLSAISIVLTSKIVLAGAVRAKSFVRLVEAIELSSRLSITGLYGERVSELLTMTGTSHATWLKTVTERMSLASAGTSRYLAVVQATEEVVFASATSAHLIITFNETETIEFEDSTNVLRALLKNNIGDVIDLGIRIASPNGSTTTWSMNARTGAISEYTNYAFNSFVQMPDGTYLGAGEDGNLYQLVGDADNGQPIVADIIGGLLDLGGSRFTQLKAAYLGVRSTGTWYLRLTTDSGVTRTYEVQTRPLKTARIDIGKGLRSRYVQWELINADGQDFDLQGIEFVPLISTRRV